MKSKNEPRGWRKRHLEIGARFALFRYLNLKPTMKFAVPTRVRARVYVEELAHINSESLSTRANHAVSKSSRITFLNSLNNVHSNGFPENGSSPMMTLDGKRIHRKKAPARHDIEARHPRRIQSSLSRETFVDTKNPRCAMARCFV